MTIVSPYRVRPGERVDFLQVVEETDVPVFEELRAEGVILAWGVREKLFHEPGEHGLYTFWITLRHTDDFDDLVRRLEERPDSAGRFLEMVDMSAHASTLHRDHLFFGVGGKE